MYNYFSCILIYTVFSAIQRDQKRNFERLNIKPSMRLCFTTCRSNWSHLGWWLIIQAEKRNKLNHEMDFHFPAKWHLRLRVKKNFPLNDALLLQSVDPSEAILDTVQAKNKTKQNKTKNEWMDKRDFPLFWFHRCLVLRSALEGSGSREISRFMTYPVWLNLFPALDLAFCFYKMF